MTSLKTAWAIDNKENSAVIISKKCRPDFEKKEVSSQEFKVIYERFSFDGESWNVTLREENGFWENVKPLDEQEFRLKFDSDRRNCCRSSENVVF